MSVINKRHPLYLTESPRWPLWRAIITGGETFVTKALLQFDRESTETFQIRKKLTPCAGHAKIGVLDVRNAMYRRMRDVVRSNLTKPYQEAMRNIDGVGTSSNKFFGDIVLTEMLFMRRVGIFVDRAVDVDTSRAGNRILPYTMIYPVEQILTWRYVNNQLVALLLLDYEDDLEDDFIKTTVPVYKKFILTPVGVQYTKYDKNGKEADSLLLQLHNIPFVMPEISSSLLNDIDKYQVALMNMTSCDISYAVRSNFPFYVEQIDERTVPTGMKEGPYDPDDQDGTTANTDKAADREVVVGASQGRTYSINAERPGFINPSPEPLKASMDKELQLIKEIHLLLRTTIENLEPTRASAESKQANDRLSQNGMITIGSALEQAEYEVSKIFNDYLGLEDTAVIKYPSVYSMITQDEAIADAKGLIEIRDTVPSIRFKREITKKIAATLLSGDVDVDSLMAIYTEIDNSDVMTTDAETIRSDTEAGLVGVDLASKLRGYPDGEAEKARKDHEDRLARIAIAQTEGAAAARGIDSGSGKGEKKASRQIDTNSTTQEPVRGASK